ncbi:uncharacterized protein SOCE26_077810 [Sorangium cellulosum]|uniref:Uncharacterized protein n=1 Tax=Sorangium cellulosum TaxID=56 RepID=A0A2L0F401_SORCE|nr:uncharacterized protein SOCE26_077810 [Sorangium cellulosum]
MRVSLPGDQPGRDPAYEANHAITLQAPPDAVWPWLARRSSWSTACSRDRGPRGGAGRDALSARGPGPRALSPRGS